VVERVRCKVKVKVAGEGRRGRGSVLQGFGVLGDLGVSVGFRGFEGRALNRAVNRVVHGAVNRFSERIQ
jgi:hypothetical protein